MSTVRSAAQARSDEITKLLVELDLWLCTVGTERAIHRCEQDGPYSYRRGELVVNLGSFKTQLLADIATLRALHRIRKGL
jgi:hypothetical protein